MSKLRKDVTYAALLGMLDRWVARSVEWDALEPFATLGIDEIALLTGHRDFVAVMSAQTDRGDLHVLAVLPDRLKATVLAWLLSMPAPSEWVSPPRAPMFGRATSLL